MKGHKLTTLSAFIKFMRWTEMFPIGDDCRICRELIKKYLLLAIAQFSAISSYHLVNYRSFNAYIKSETSKDFDLIWLYVSSVVFYIAVCVLPFVTCTKINETASFLRRLNALNAQLNLQYSRISFNFKCRLFYYVMNKIVTTTSNLVLLVGSHSSLILSQAINTFLLHRLFSVNEFLTIINDNQQLFYDRIHNMTIGYTDIIRRHKEYVLIILTNVHKLNRRMCSAFGFHILICLLIYSKHILQIAFLIYMHLNEKMSTTKWIPTLLFQISYNLFVVANSCLLSYNIKMKVTLLFKPYFLLFNQF